MKFYSTKRIAPDVELKEAVITGLPSDNGLYMPEKIRKLDDDFIEGISDLDFPELAFRVADRLLEECIPTVALRDIVFDAINFEAPLVKLNDNLHCLELFHGPSLAFKDFGARFMARIMSYFMKEESQKLTILVATSGDTGGAVAKGFYETDIDVVILYPSGKISDLQEKQLTTLGKNITALEIQGTFDDCQKLVKTAFLDQSLRNQMFISSANSINIARLIPQSFYYFRAMAQLEDNKTPVCCTVPSGNFGNLTAGLIARKMGLPIGHFVAAVNSNDVFPQYLSTNVYQPKPSVPTLSNAMDVGAPSNLQRIQDLYGSKGSDIAKRISSWSYDDASTRKGIQEMYEKFGYVACPHTAVGYLGMKQHLKEHPDQQGIILSTAHPAKFIDIVEEALGQKVELPDALAELVDKQKDSIVMSTDYDPFREYLLSRSLVS